MKTAEDCIAEFLKGTEAEGKPIETDVVHNAMRPTLLKMGDYRCVLLIHKVVIAFRGKFTVSVTFGSSLIALPRLSIYQKSNRKTFVQGICGALSKQSLCLFLHGQALLSASCTSLRFEHYLVGIFAVDEWVKRLFPDNFQCILSSTSLRRKFRIANLSVSR